MSFSIKIFLPETFRGDAALAARYVSVCGGLNVSAANQVSGVCQCLFIDEDNLLAEPADRDAETWKLNDSVLGHLCVTLMALYGEFPEGFGFEACWSGDAAQMEQECSLSGMEDIVTQNKIRSKTRYFIT